MAADLPVEGAWRGEGHGVSEGNRREPDGAERVRRMLAALYFAARQPCPPCPVCCHGDITSICGNRYVCVSPGTLRPVTYTCVHGQHTPRDQMRDKTRLARDLCGKKICICGALCDSAMDKKFIIMDRRGSDSKENPDSSPVPCRVSCVVCAIALASTPLSGLRTRPCVPQARPIATLRAVLLTALGERALILSLIHI